MKKRLLSLLLAAMMLVSMLPVSALAADDVAMIGDVGYESLHAALEAAVAIKGKVVVEVLAESIDGSDWEAINFNSYPSKAADSITIEGNNCTITNLAEPLIGSVWTGSELIINDITVTGADIDYSGLGAAAFVGTADSIDAMTLENCHVVDSEVSGGYAAGLIGWVSGYSRQDDGPVHTEVYITDCSVSGSSFTGSSSTGALVGHAGSSDWTDLFIEDCEVGDNDITCTDENYGRPDKVGTAVGRVNNGILYMDVTETAESTLVPAGNVADRVLGAVAGGSATVTGGEYYANPLIVEKISNSTLDGEAPVLAQGMYLVSGDMFTVTDEKPAISTGNVAYDSIEEAVAAIGSTATEEAPAVLELSDSSSSGASIKAAADAVAETENENISLSVDTNSATVSFDSAAVSAISTAAAAEEAEEVTLVVEETEVPENIEAPVSENT